ncbi:MAG: alpha/beta fold hydrolase [Pseudolabrys sp.]|jgi:pimeloyl-ACP methyl ester carboxylesterase
MTAHADIAGTAPGRAAGIAFLRTVGREGARPVLLLHGIGSNATSFAPMMAMLPASLDVIAWHAPGYGGSQPLADPHPAPAGYAGALSRLLDALNVDRVVLAGHSLGCLFAARFAVQNPQRVSALALLSPALGYHVAPGGDLPPMVQSRIDEIRTLGTAEFADKRAARLLYQPQTKPALLASVRNAMAAVDRDGYAQAAYALGAGDLLADATRIDTQTLVAVGAHDVVTPPANARMLYAALSQQAGYHEIPDAGHALPQEDPAAVARLLMQLIEASDA